MKHYFRHMEYYKEERSKMLDAPKAAFALYLFNSGFFFLSPGQAAALHSPHFLYYLICVYMINQQLYCLCVCKFTSTVALYISF